MKAIKWMEKQNVVEIITAPRPTNPATKHVIIKVAYSGICGTDLHIIQKEFAAAKEVILGHEISGTVQSVGEAVTHLSVGDKVTVDPNSSCGKCRFCVRNKVNYCVTGGLRGTVGIFTDGGWAEYVEVPVNQVATLPPGISLKQGVLCEPYSCIARGWDNNSLVPDDSDILVMGTGIIGLLWTCLFHHHGYRNVIVTEPSEIRRNIFKGMCLGYEIYHPDEMKTRFDSLESEVDGFDLIVDCSGNEKAVEAAFAWLRRGGMLNVFGCCPKKSKMTIHPAEFMLREVSIIGTLINPFTYPKTIQLVANMANRYLDYDKLGIEVFALEKYEEAISRLKSGSISKAVFKISDD